MRSSSWYVEPIFWAVLFDTDLLGHSTSYNVNAMPGIDQASVMHANRLDWRHASLLYVRGLLNCSYVTLTAYATVPISNLERSRI